MNKEFIIIIVIMNIILVFQASLSESFWIQVL